MSEVARIANQLKRVAEGPAWHGASLREVLQDVTPLVAAAPSPTGGHSIWQLVLHVAAWQDGVRRRLAGDPANLSSEEEWPPVTDTSAAAWQQAVERLRTSQQALQA